jgi:hypothetical protein
LADLEDLLEELAALGPEDQAELAGRLGIALPAAAAPEYAPDEWDDEPLDDWEVNDILSAWRSENLGIARQLSPEDWQGAGEFVAQGYSVEDALELYAEDHDEQDLHEDVARIQSEAEAREGRALLPSEQRALFAAWQKSEAEGRPELDWKPLDLMDTEQRGQYMAQRLNGDDQGAVQHSLEQRADDNGGVTFDLDGSSDDRAAYLEARLADAVEPITEGPPEHDAPEGAE